MATKIKMIKEDATELLDIALKDKKVTAICIGNSYINFVHGKAKVSDEILAAIKESGLELE